LLTDVFDTKAIHYKGEDDGAQMVFPQARCVWGLGVAMEG
jgi:hypothetical protein